MELGERLRKERLAAGLSQRALCGGEITRNMLSQIEHGTARPSMATLSYLAAQLGKPVSYFLEEDTVTSPNQEIMTRARDAYDAGNPADALDVLTAYRSPDPVFDAERGLLLSLAAMALAEEAIENGRKPYAVSLLEAIRGDSPYYTRDLERRRLLLLASACPEQTSHIAAALPPDDGALLLRAEAAIDRGDFTRAGQLLDAAEDHESPRWNFLRGEVYFSQKEYKSAAERYHLSESEFPGRAIPRLEECYRELGDFQMAYAYACKQKADCR